MNKKQKGEGLLQPWVLELSNPCQWDIITALRGPDTPGMSVIKASFTCFVRSVCVYNHDDFGLRYVPLTNSSFSKDEIFSFLKECPKHYIEHLYRAIQIIAMDHPVQRTRMEAGRLEFRLDAFWYRVRMEAIAERTRKV